VKRNPKKAKRTSDDLRVWTFAQAQQAAPYIASVVRSLREHGLETLARHRYLRRLANRPGRPDRSTLIAMTDAQRDLANAQDQFTQAIEDLHQLDIYSLEPLMGQALVPFVHDDQLAWYMFDLFDSQPFRFWRFQSDSDDTRRPLTSWQKGLADSKPREA
jgi:hypothetical protein